MTLPECQRIKLDIQLPDGDLPSYDTIQPKTCQELPGKVTGSSMRRGSIDFPHDQAPLIIISDGLLTYFSATSDNVIAIEASTVGYGRAENIVGELTAKFGKPTIDRIDKQVVDSTPLPSRHVVWRRAGFTVDYQSISDVDVRYGELMIRTDDYDRLDGADAVKDVSRRTPL